MVAEAERPCVYKQRALAYSELYKIRLGVLPGDTQHHYGVLFFNFAEAIVNAVFCKCIAAVSTEGRIGKIYNRRVFLQRLRKSSFQLKGI